MACCQGNVFSEETKQHNKKPTTPRNQTSTPMEFNDSDKYMPPDFMGNKTWLDFMKVRRLSTQFHKNSDYLFITENFVQDTFTRNFPCLNQIK